MEQASLEERMKGTGADVAGAHRTPNGLECSDGFDLNLDPIPDLETGTLEPTDPQLPQGDKIKHVPKEVGVMLITAGIVGVILPGPGVPAVIAGGLALWPQAFGKLESWLVRRNPGLHRKSVKQINRFLDDLEKRYPNSTNL